jgi:hypothetical protein
VLGTVARVLYSDVRIRWELVVRVFYNVCFPALIAVMSTSKMWPTPSVIRLGLRIVTNIGCEELSRDLDVWRQEPLSVGAAQLASYAIVSACSATSRHVCVCVCVFAKLQGVMQECNVRVWQRY